MPRHSARHRVDRIFDPYALLLEEVGHLTDGMLRLRDGHSVARNNDYLLGLLHEEGRVLGGTPFVRPVDGSRLATARYCAEASRNHRQEAAIHRAAHDVAEDCTRASDERAGDDHRA